jgi:hypothetical protein
MKEMLIASTLIFILTACSSTEMVNKAATSTYDTNSGELHEQQIPGSKKPERKKVHIAQPGISTNTILNGVADVMIDGRLESDSLKKKNAIHVLIDDAVESTGDIEDLKANQPNKIKIPK